MWNPANYDDRAIGPMGLHDAHLLDAICRYVRPRVYLEYGGLLGHSLAVAAPHCGQVISVDDNAGEILRLRASEVTNARVVKARMEQYDPASDGVKSLDMVFFDASHVFDQTVAAYDKVRGLLTPGALLLVHDTGDWYAGPDPLPPQWEAWKGHRAKFLVDDREFVLHLRNEGWLDVTFQSASHLRHGITVLARPNF